MSKMIESAQVLAALSTIQDRAKAGVDDNMLAAFIEGKLGPKEHDWVMTNLAQNSALLHELVEANEVLQQTTSVEGVVKGKLRLMQWMKQFWLRLIASGGLAAIFLIWILSQPSMTLSQIEQDLLASQTMTRFDSEEVSISVDKGLDMGKSAARLDFEYGIRLTQDGLQLQENNRTLRSCGENDDCHRQRVMVLLGRWAELNRVQCNSSLSVAQTFWDTQFNLYQYITAEFTGEGVTVPTIINSRKASVCKVQSQLHNLSF